MPETATVQITMPEMGESVTEGIVLEWHVAEGDAVKEGDTVVEVSTDKVDAEVPAPADGVITKLIAQVDDEVAVGAPLAEMEAGADGAGDDGERPAGPVSDTSPAPAGAGPASSPPAGEAQSSSGSNGGNGAADVKATPVARRVAEATGVDLASLSGSGPGAKVTKDDVLAA
ncbi:MAG TPA: biotin/lipoyl-containing protein, partial [Solirubrobacterales bacterium]|nr:biotin/lipoyl-containing protein [Solirubrobacterales bacterium]